MSTLVTIAEGSLRATPFAHLLVSAFRKKLTGTLAVWPDDERKGQDRIRFDAGQIVAARLLEPAESLERGLLPIFRREAAPFAVYEGDLVGEGPGVHLETVEIRPLLAAGLRGGGRDDVIDAVLANFGEQRVTVSSGFDSRAFALTTKELACVDSLRAGGVPVASFVSSSAEPKVARRIAYLLAITANLERVESRDASTGRMTLDSGAIARASLPGLSSPPPGSDPSLPSISSLPPSPPSSPGSGGAQRPTMPRADRRKANAFAPPPPPPERPVGLTADASARWDDLADRVVRSDEQNHFVLLGLGETDGGSAARNAYFDLVKRVHPDRLTPELAPLRPFVERLFQQITDARETLEDDEKRMAYVRNVKNGGGTPASDRRLMGALAAAHELEKATVLSNMGKWTEVLDALEDAKIFDPSQLDIYALEAWSLFNLLGKSAHATTDRILELTEKVLLEPGGENHERARYTRALVLKKLGKEPEAIELLRKIIARNPKHLDAAREVRLFEMRSRDASKSPATSGSALPESAGFLSKLFGKKE